MRLNGLSFLLASAAYGAGSSKKYFSTSAKKTQLSLLASMDSAVLQTVPSIKSNIEWFDAILGELPSIMYNDTLNNFTQPCLPYSFLEDYNDRLTRAASFFYWDRYNNLDGFLVRVIPNATAYNLIKKIVDDNLKLKDLRYKVTELWPQMKLLLKDTIYDDSYADFNATVVPRLIDGWEAYTDLTVQLNEKSVIAERVRNLTNCRANDTYIGAYVFVNSTEPIYYEGAQPLYDAQGNYITIRAYPFRKVPGLYFTNRTLVTDFKTTTNGRGVSVFNATGLTHFTTF